MKKLLLLSVIFFLSLGIKAQAKYYINSNTGQPWGSNTNISAMDAAFGAGNWNQDYLETVNVNALFQPTVCFIFLEGSDNNATALNNFLSVNMTALQNWVSAGGKLLLNAAPNVGGNINFGFGGVTLIYPGSSGTASNSPGMAAHPIFSGPAAPAGTNYTGTSFSHAYISGGITVPVLDGASGPPLTEGFYGLGRVMFGGMTTTNWHSPQPNAANFRANIFSYLGGCCGASPSITLTANPASGICSGQSVTLTASGANGGTYTLFPGNITGTSVVISPTVTTNYNVVATPTSGCTGGATIKITVSNTVPVVGITGTNVICTGNPFSLTATGAVNYTWSNGALTSSIAPTPTANTTYSVIGTNGCGSNTAAINVTVNTSPTVAVSGNTLICGTGTNVLTATGANTYSWSNGPTTSSVSVSPTVTTTYSVTGTGTLAGNCSNTQTITVFVSFNPTVAASGPTAAICGGTSVNLVGSGATSYSWSNGALTQTAVVSPTTSTSYTLNGTTLCGSGTAVVNVTVNPAPSLSITGNTLICGTGTAVLTVSGANTYSWSNGPTTSTIAVSPSVTTVYTVTGTSTLIGNCVSTLVQSVVVSSNPTVSISGPSVAICQNAAVNLNASGASTYSWSNGSTGASIAPTASTSTTYSVIGTNTAGCTGTANFSVSVTPAPVLTVTGAATICVGMGQTVALSVSGANTYSWSSGQTTSSITVSPSVTTVYTAYGTSSVTGCTGISAVSVVVSPCTGISQLSQTLVDVRVYPNPSTGEFTVDLKNLASRGIEVSDISGRIVWSASVTNDTVNVDLSQLNNGIYFLKVLGNSSSHVVKVIKQ